MKHHKKLTKETIDEWVVKEPNSGCWVWMGSMNKGGYGTAKGTLAHRVVYGWFKGVFEKSLDLMHLCHNRICVNPDHLQPGTRYENVMMSVNADRWNSQLRSKTQSAIRRSESKNGFLIGRNPKFTETQVKGIRRLVQFGIDKYKLGESLGVTGQAINAIVKRKSYAYVL